MSRPTIKIHDVQTNQEIEREMTAAEFADYEAANEQIETIKQQSEAKSIAKQSAMDKLTALGLTADEVAALIP